MSESIPRARRPLLLLLAMLVCLAMGWSGMVSGCNYIKYYRAPTSSEALAQPEGDTAEQRAMAELVRSFGPLLDSSRKVLVPLSAADLVLSALLVFAATRALGGRPGSWPLAVQAVLANAALTVVTYVLSRSFRGASIALVASQWPHIAELHDPTMKLDEPMVVSVLWGLHRALLVGSLLIYGGALAVLFRPSSRAYLSAATPADASAGDGA